MLRPLVMDVLAVLIPILLAGLLFVVGRRLHRWPKPVRILLVALPLLVIVLVTATFLWEISETLSDMIYVLGGGTVILCWTALMLLGVVWSAPGRSLSSSFMACLVVVAGGLIFLESSGRLWWRFLAPELWRRTANAQGCLNQSSGLTCSPTAAVMLLHHYGIASSEGEMAYLADTSVFGTAGHFLARGLARKVAARGWSASVRRAIYETCVKDAQAVIAHIRHPEVGNHAIFVKKLTEEFVDIVDPLDGVPSRMTAAEFQRLWDGTIVRIEFGE